MSPTLRADGISPTFLRLLETEPLGRMEILDVGTGRGRLALALAPHCRRVVGIDVDAEADRRGAAPGGRDRASGTPSSSSPTPSRWNSSSLAAGDAHFRPDMVVAHLYLSARLVEESGRALPPGGVLAFVGFHADQWRETGRRSRFAWSEPDIQDLLKRCDFLVEHLEVETEVKTFGSVEEALAAVIGLEERWRQDGRWFHYIKYLEQGGRELTRSHLVVKARRR